MENPHSILKKVFGYDSFRPGQEEIVSRLLAGQDVLAVMPTGAGKSICYQVPALLLPGITIVVSPLVSLMKDQVGALVQAGVAAAFLNNSLTDNQKALMLHRAREGWYKIIYVAPERQHGHGGRGALHQPVGTGFPPQLSAHQGVCGQPAQPPGHGRVHRHRHRPCAGGYPHPSGAASALRGDYQLRPPQPVLRDPAGTAQPEAQGAAGTGAQRGQSCGHRVLQHHPAGGRDGAAAAEPQHPGGSLPRQAGCGHPAAESGRFSL